MSYRYSFTGPNSTGDSSGNGTGPPHPGGERFSPEFDFTALREYVRSNRGEDGQGRGGAVGQQELGTTFVPAVGFGPVDDTYTTAGLGSSEYVGFGTGAPGQQGLGRSGLVQHGWVDPLGLPTQGAYQSLPAQETYSTLPAPELFPTLPAQNMYPTQPAQDRYPPQPAQPSWETFPTQSMQPAQQAYPTQSAQPAQPTQKAQKVQKAKRAPKAPKVPKGQKAPRVQKTQKARPAEAVPHENFKEEDHQNQQVYGGRNSQQSQIIDEHHVRELLQPSQANGNAVRPLADKTTNATTSAPTWSDQFNKLQEMARSPAIDQAEKLNNLRNCPSAFLDSVLQKFRKSRSAKSTTVPDTSLIISIDDDDDDNAQGENANAPPVPTGRVASNIRRASQFDDELLDVTDVPRVRKGRRSSNARRASQRVYDDPNFDTDDSDDLADFTRGFMPPPPPKGSRRSEYIRVPPPVPYVSPYLNNNTQSGYTTASAAGPAPSPYLPAPAPRRRAANMAAQPLNQNLTQNASAYAQPAGPNPYQPGAPIYQPINIFTIPPDAVPQQNVDLTMTEETYTPLIKDRQPPLRPGEDAPVYAPYRGYFTTSADAKKHRHTPRILPKTLAIDIERVLRFGRLYWVERIYNSMIDISRITDGPNSIHRTRYTQRPLVFSQIDLEACAHHVFDNALAAHTRGWNRPTVYHKKVVRGKLVDISELSIESRLHQICQCLRLKKAAVDDAMRGGVTLALLCDNPEARGFTKTSNNCGNKVRGKRLRLVKTLEEGGKKAEGERDEEVGGDDDEGGLSDE